MAASELHLKHDLAFEDLHRREGLVRLDAAFVQWLGSVDVDLHNRLAAARRDPDALDAKAHSQLLIDLAPHLEDFVGNLFGIEPEVRALQARHHALAPLYAVKRLFVQRRAVKGMTPEKAAALDGRALGRELETSMGEALTESNYAAHVSRWMAAEADHAAALDLAARYAAWATLSPEGQARHGRGAIFKVPHKLELTHLIPVETVVEHGVTMLRLGPEHRRARDGFALTDPGMDLTAALDHANYCIWCH
ncbi:MAG TPA: pyridine nucleotide-disulfide oxidoreductase, partial [Stellaceae bacterium]|nr:pyridine nucleotide-disulfide oxidoreductase [Stellaceae bacterium]